MCDCVSYGGRIVGIVVGFYFDCLFCCFYKLFELLGCEWSNLEWSYYYCIVCVFGYGIVWSVCFVVEVEKWCSFEVFGKIIDDEFLEC